MRGFLEQLEFKQKLEIQRAVNTGKTSDPLIIQIDQLHRLLESGFKVDLDDYPSIVVQGLFQMQEEVAAKEKRLSKLGKI